MKHFRRLAARLAIIAMLIDGLLPTAMSAAARADATAPLLPVCSAEGGMPLPLKEVPAIPARHCALCAVCSACIVGLLPSRAGSELTSRLLAGSAHSTAFLSIASASHSADYETAQPRAPPIAFS